MINCVLGKLRSKSSRNALSLLLYYVLILNITPHLSEVQTGEKYLFILLSTTCHVTGSQAQAMAVISLPNDNSANSVRETKLTVSLRTRH